MEEAYNSAFTGAQIDEAVRRLTAGEVVPTSRTVNGKALSENISLIPTDLGLGKTLTFTGAVSATYDGTADQTICLPAGGSGGKRTCRLVVGTAAAGWTIADCDYLCDGSADQAEINAALAALPATGGEVVVLDGVYNLTGRISVTKNNTTLTGNGSATVFKRLWNSTASEGMIHLTSSENTIQNVRIDGNKSAYTASYNVGILIAASSSNNLISRNRCEYSNTGIGTNSSCSNVISGNRCGHNQIAISVFQGADNLVNGNICTGNDGSGINAAGGYSIAITGNTCTLNSDDGILLSNGCQNSEVTGNTCNDNSNAGIYLGGSCGNTVTGNGCVGNTIGISLFFSHRNTVVGNTFLRGTGVAGDYTASQFTIKSYGIQYNYIALNGILGKNYVAEGEMTGTEFLANKYK